MAAVEQQQQLGEAWLEEEIARELELLSVEDLENEEDTINDEEEKENTLPEALVQDQLPSCLHSYLQVLGEQQQHTVAMLEETRHVLKLSSLPSFSPSPSPSPPSERCSWLTDRQQGELVLVEEEEDMMEPCMNKELLAALAKLDQEKRERERELEEEEKQMKELICNMQEQARLELVKFENIMHERQLEEERRREKAVVILQSAWRAVRVCREYRPLIKEQIEMTRKKEEEEKRKERMLEHAAHTLQGAWRKYRQRALVRCVLEAGRKEMRRKMRRRAAEVIQSWWRMRRWSKMLTALKMKEKEKAQQQQQQQEEEEESCVSSVDACSQSGCESVSPQPATISITTPTVLPTTTSQPATKPPSTISTFQPVTSAPPTTPTKATPPQLTISSTATTHQPIQSPNPPASSQSVSSTVSLHSAAPTSTVAQKSSETGNKGISLPVKQAGLVAASDRDKKTLKTVKDNKQDLDQVEEELVKMRELRESWAREEEVAEESRERMERLMAARESVAVECDRGSSEYRTRLEHAACPLSARAWMGLMEERMKKWQESTFVRKPVNTACYHTSPPTLQQKSSMQLKRPLSDAQLLDASPPGTSLDEVAMVHVYRSRSPIDLSSLSKCPNLQSLSLTKCAVTAFTSVGDCSPHLQELCLPTNTLELMDCSLLPQLKFLDVSDNRLASIHGLQHCHHLLELNIADNRIARTGGLWACQKLQLLMADGNLVINSAGLECLHCLQHLSLAENHLPKLMDVVNCPLLQYVNIRQNNLQQCPELVNHAVLRELYLDENSISDISPLCNGWLPLLQTLSLANNCIMEIASLLCCVMLENLNVAHNSLYDLPMFLQSVRGCFQLKSLDVSGNPITQENKYRSYLVKAVPSLKEIDGESVRRTKKSSTTSSVSTHPLHQLLCQQLTEQDAMKEKHRHTISFMEQESGESPVAIATIINTRVANCRDYHYLLMRHLDEQRLFDCRSSEPVTVKIQKRRLRAATLLQAHYRGWSVRRWSLVLLQQWRAACVIQSAWRRRVLRRRRREERRSRRSRRRRESAAIMIQAHVRGHLLRQRLRKVLREAPMQDDEELGITVGSEEMEEILSGIDEELLDSDWKPMSPTEDQVDSMVTAMATYHSSNHHHRHHVKTLPTFTLPGTVENDEEEEEKESAPIAAVLPTHIATQGWESPKELIPKHDAKVLQTNQFPTPLPTGQQRREQLADEWGFANPETAKLLLRRAGRHCQLRARSEQRKKMADPTERLTQFKRVTETHLDLKRERRNRNAHHFRELSPIAKESQDVEFQWQHTHQVIHRDALPLSPALSSPHSHTRRTNSHSCSLPELEPHVLAGHVLRLVSCDAQNRLTQHSVGHGHIDTPSQAHNSKFKFKKVL